jgi:hypothetical protein
MPVRHTLLQSKVFTMVETPQIKKVPRPACVKRVFSLTPDYLLIRTLRLRGNDIIVNSQTRRTHKPGRLNERSSVHGRSFK